LVLLVKNFLSLPFATSLTTLKRIEELKCQRRESYGKNIFPFTLPAFLISVKTAAQGNVKLAKRRTIPGLQTVLNPARDHISNENPTDSMTNDDITLHLTVITTPATELALLVKPARQLSLAEPMTGKIGRVTVVREPAKNSLPKQISPLTQKLMDAAFRFFKVVPNPVSSGASLHIEWKQTEEGYFTFELLAVSGKKIYSKEIWIDREARLLNLEIPSVRAGNYFLRATNKISGKGFTEKIVIE